MKLDPTMIRLLGRLTDRMDLIRKHPLRYGDRTGGPRCASPGRRGTRTAARNDQCDQGGIAASRRVAREGVVKRVVKGCSRGLKPPGITETPRGLKGPGLQRHGAV